MGSTINYGELRKEGVPADQALSHQRLANGRELGHATCHAAAAGTLLVARQRRFRTTEKRA